MNWSKRTKTVVFLVGLAVLICAMHCYTSDANAAAEKEYMVERNANVNAALKFSCKDYDGNKAFNDQLTTKSTVTAYNYNYANDLFVPTGKSWTFSDTCLNTGLFGKAQSTMVKEYTCNKGVMNSISITCPRYAPLCMDGRCVAGKVEDMEAAMKINQRLADER